MSNSNAEGQNPLYPIFLKLHTLRMLLVGAGEVGYEKLSFILKSSPDAQITVVAPRVSAEVEELVARSAAVRLIRRPFLSDDLRGKDLVIAATDQPEVNVYVRNESRKRGILVNVADTPDLCDFYLGSIVTRGNLKVAISTNGQSPTFAKRFRQVLEAVLPEETGDLLEHLKVVRDRLTGDFSSKIRQLNALTATLAEQSHPLAEAPDPAPAGKVLP